MHSVKFSVIDRRQKFDGTKTSWCTKSYKRRRLAGRQKQQLFPLENIEFDNFGIPGLGVASNPRYGRVTKFVCTVIIILIYVMCVYQVSVRIKTYFDNPISIDVVVESRQYLHFPTVTLCPWYPLKNNKELYELRELSCHKCPWQKVWNVDVFDLLLLPNVTVQTIWDMASINATAISQHEITYNTFLNNRLEIIKKEVITLMGTCVTARFSQKLRYRGGYTGIFVDMEDTPNVGYWQYMIILHEDPEELPYTILKSAGISFHHEFETDIALSIKESKYADTPTNPCRNPNEFRSCVSDCTNNFILSNITCKLPYLKTKLLNDCITPEEAKHTYNVTLTVYENFEELCRRCHRPCLITHYGLNMDCIKKHDPTRIKVMLSNNFVESITETASYNFVMFFGDIGGTVGFFLGMCMINVVHMFTSTAVWINDAIDNRFRNRNQPTFY